MKKILRNLLTGLLAFAAAVAVLATMFAFGVFPIWLAEDTGNYNYLWFYLIHGFAALYVAGSLIND